MKINFDLVQVFTNLEKTECIRQNMRKDFANLIYTRGAGIECHALALKIYNGNQETEYTDEEVALILQFSKMCTPCVMDAFETMLSQNE